MNKPLALFAFSALLLLGCTQPSSYVNLEGKSFAELQALDAPVECLVSGDETAMLYVYGGKYYYNSKTKAVLFDGERTLAKPSNAPSCDWVELDYADASVDELLAYGALEAGYLESLPPSSLSCEPDSFDSTKFVASGSTCSLKELLSASPQPIEEGGMVKTAPSGNEAPWVSAEPVEPTPTLTPAQLKETVCGELTGGDKTACGKVVEQGRG